MHNIHCFIGHLLLHPAISDACVVSLEDEYSGELPYAYVVVSPSAKETVGDMRDAARLKDTISKVSLIHASLR